ncbi:MAG: methylenetetrahydrofolate--tRNA-(uracil(54)-C(5))-methyltransferase (FADH(2)-oxidizing) TrmFO, partial [Bdellovibrionales bacterium]|nr:methylenetetrahydrofolate--tRNA-(uracil(54)-C(5))-methyltransferase (FADH(2)-oxidizing) TrmFO [Bdellovibrionales bacterium]
KSAKENSVPAGTALGVDRIKFSQSITQILLQHPNITIVDKPVDSLDDLPRPAVIATGPLTSDALAKSLAEHFDSQFLYFYDAIAPIIDADSIDLDACWFGDRFDRGTKDYLNCPLNQEQYDRLIQEISNARKVEAKDFEKDIPYFDGCMPIETMIERGPETPRFGPMSPKGLQQQGPEWRKHAVVQLRKENKEGSAYSMVGFQTKMAYSEQTRVFRMIPGLENAEFLKLGSIHRNLYIHSPKMLNLDLSSKKDPQLFFAGQITGVEGYFESTSVGLLVALILHQKLSHQDVVLPHRSTALGSLHNAITEPKDNFQPTNMNFSHMPVPEGFKGRRNREKKREHQIHLAQQALLEQLPLFSVNS